jgi:GTP-binding protein HflX
MTASPDDYAPRYDDGDVHAYDTESPEDADDPGYVDLAQPLEDELALAERQALRRVPGCPPSCKTSAKSNTASCASNAWSWSGCGRKGTVADAERSLAELALLAQTAGSQVLDALIQRRQRPDPATYVGRGKVEALHAATLASGADTVICDGELTPAQLRNLEDRIQVKVVDRTALILDIFAQHAKSAEGKAQVELAQLEYMKQRLRGWGGNLSRQVGGRVGAQGGGIGGRGPGETKIETDRRRINTKIAKLRRELTQLRTTRDTKRAQRLRRDVPSVAIAGYTNAGKSSLLNRLTGAGVLVEDALFATLDPATRRTTTSDGRVFTLSDTVGFVRHLPHGLIEAFRSTLEEVADADLIVHVVDGSDADPEGQIAAVREVLAETGRRGGGADRPEQGRRRGPHGHHQAARPRAALRRRVRPHRLRTDDLRAAIEADLPHPQTEVNVLLPYARGDLMSRIHERGEVVSVDHTGEGTAVVARVNAGLAAEAGALLVTSV